MRTSREVHSCGTEAGMQKAIQRLQEGATQADLARTHGVSQATISRLGAA
jgi:predicted transcriptional regulator